MPGRKNAMELFYVRLVARRQLAEASAFCERETVAAARDILADEMRSATRMEIKWIDRGVSSEASTFRGTYRKYRTRAVIKGIKKSDGTMQYHDSVAARFADDEGFRRDMEELGWSSEKVCLIDAIALLPAIADQRLGVGAVGLGWLRAATGIGAL